MKLIMSYTPKLWLTALLLCAGYALLQVAVLYPLVSFPFALLLLKCFLDAMMFSAIGWLLAVIIPSSNYVKFDSFQKYVNFSALGLIVVLLWVSLFILSSYLVFGGDGVQVIRPLLPLAAFIGIMIYVIQLLVILRRMEVGSDSNGEQEEDENAPGNIGDENDYEKSISENGVTGVVNSNENEPETMGNLERIAVRVGPKIHVIMVPEIVYILSDGDYVKIVTNQGKYLKEETMKFFETGLPQSQFVRVHRSYIVNVEKILRIELYEKQIRLLTLKNGDKIRASVAGYKALKSVLNL